MALYGYLQNTQLLLNDPNMAAFNRADLISYINTARNQIAGEGECVRALGTLATVNAQQSYPFSGITLGGSGIAAALNVRMITVVVASGAQMLTARGWEWFNNYNLSVVVPATGQPNTWTQYAQGLNGTIYLYPIPNAVFNLSLDTVCTPSPLALDTDPEAIPSPWTDAIPYFAAYLALLAAQRAEEAYSMFRIFETFMLRARKLATPTVLPGQYQGMQGARGASSAVPTTGQLAEAGGMAMPAQRRGG